MLEEQIEEPRQTVVTDDEDDDDDSGDGELVTKFQRILAKKGTLCEPAHPQKVHDN